LAVKDWNHIHYALAVARAGTLSGAAGQLGVAHSTVLRRVDALEKSLNTRLFHRHARGYVPTEAGRMLMSAAENMRDQLDLLVGRVQGVDEALQGTLVITTVSNLAVKIMPVFKRFQQLYPEVRLELSAESRQLRLDRGEAHVGIRPGARPQEQDYVVQRGFRLSHSLYASPAYLREYGALQSLAQIAGHRFIASSGDTSFIPFMRWLNAHVPEEQIALRCNSFDHFYDAVRAGIGIAPLNSWNAQGDDQLRQLLPPPDDWATDVWLVTHRDMHRTRKVQAFLQLLKQELAQLGTDSGAQSQ
jgi:DNA-binding transcriptional LysR family regulator